MQPIDLALATARLGLGPMMVAHGVNKVRGGLKGTAGWFASMGMKPGALHARLAATTEIGAGALFTLGLFTPLAAAGFVGLMVVAIVVAHRSNGFFIFRPGQGWEYCMVIALGAAAVGMVGAGRWSLDHAVGIDDWHWWGPALTGIGLVGAALQLLVFYRPEPKAPTP